jgi:hypothetical protein
MDHASLKAAIYTLVPKTQNKHRNISMPRLGLENTTPVLGRAKRIHVLDREALVFDLQNLHLFMNCSVGCGVGIE